MNPLVTRLQGQSISLHDYIQLCLFDPKHGYYTQQNPLGRSGDFVTSPEISPFFGECIAFWIYQQWQDMGSPPRWTLMEWGPGRGTLLQDILRVLMRIPHMTNELSIVLWELNPHLMQAQRNIMQHYPHIPVRWVSEPEPCEDPFIVIGNEFWDVWPVHQYVCEGINQWAEVYVHYEDTLKTKLTPIESMWRIAEYFPLHFVDQAQAGDIIEWMPTMESLAQSLSCFMKQTRSSRALFIDYGYEAPTLRHSTTQAIYKHKPVDLLQAPGLSDISAHVNFYALRKYFADQGLQVQLSSQQEFLKLWGVDVRLQQCLAQNVEKQDAILAGFNRIVYHMGSLFKVCEVKHC